MSVENQYMECNTKPNDKESNIILLKNKKGGVLLESETASKKLLGELQDNAKSLQTKIESTWKQDEWKRKERGNLEVKSLWNNRYSFESHWITTEFENIHYDKKIETMPTWSYENEVILKSWETLFKVKILWDYEKFVDLLNNINFLLANAKKYQKNAPDRKEKFCLMWEDWIMTMTSHFKNSRTVELKNWWFTSKKWPNMIDPNELVKYLNVRYKIMASGSY